MAALYVELWARDRPTDGATFMALGRPVYW
jgi:hypothetical protein